MKYFETQWLSAGLLVLLSVSVLSCSGSRSPTWTLLVYMDGDNDLGSAAMQNISAMASAGASDNVNVIIQVDLPQGITTKRYRMKNGGWELLADLGELDMAKSQTLTDFLSWAKGVYPADRTILVLWDHGNGWDQGDGPSSPAPKISRSMFNDQDNGDRNFLPNHQIKKAILASGLAIDLLGIDACTMGTIETLYEFREVAPIIISSEEESEAHGWDYYSLLAGLIASPEMSIEDFARLAVRSYRDFYENSFYPSQPAAYDRRYTVSAIRTSYLPLLAGEVDRLAGNLMGLLSDPATAGDAVTLIKAARDTVQPIDRYIQPNVYVDLVDLDSRLGQGTDIAAVTSAATIAEYHGSDRPNAHGISIVFFPSRQTSTYDPNYKNFDPLTNTGNGGDFINQFRWDEFLNVYYDRAGL